MASIPASQAMGMYTQLLIDKFKENPMPHGFLRSFFTKKTSRTRYVSIAVERGTEKIAVDVLRGSDGNRNTFSKSTLKVIDPPYYREYFDATELDVYDRIFSSQNVDGTQFGEFIHTVGEKLQVLKAKIERAIELQCAQVLQTGVVTVADGTNIDFKRKAGSLVDGTATAWTGAVDPYAQLAAGAEFLRTTGKAEGAVVNVIMGSLAASALFNNATFIARNDLKNIQWDSVRAPQRDSVGKASHGQITIGDYLANLYTYPEFYEDAAGVMQPYIDPKKIIMLPEAPRFTLAFALVPQLVTPERPTPVEGDFVYGDYIDARKHTHEWDVRSCPIAVPTAVDQMYTRQVVA